MDCDAFRRWTVTIPAFGERAYHDADWGDALVVVTQGVLELEGLSGRSWRFPRGAIVWLTGLPLRTLRNPYEETVILAAVARGAMSSAAPARLSCEREDEEPSQ